MGLIGRPLFTGRADVSDLVRHHEGQIAQHVEDYPTSKFDAKSDQEVADEIVGQMRIDPLVIDFENGSKSADEITLEVSDMFGDRARVPGYRVTKTFPFSGDAALFGYGTGQWGSMMPRGEVGHGQLTIGMEVRTSEGDSAAEHINSTVEQLKDYVARQAEQLNEFNATLPMRVLPQVQARRNRRDGVQNLLSKF